MPVKISGAIAAGHAKTAEAGIEMLRLGGNAFDAAVAAVLASFVVESPLTSAGGGGFLLAHTQQNQNILFDFFTQTPRQKRQHLDFRPVDINFGDAIQEFHIGLGSMAVPGNIGGIVQVHERLGRLPLRVVAEPAIDYARSGVAIDSFQAYCLALLEPILTGSRIGRSIYAPTGKLLRVGEVMTMPDFANTLEYLTEQGVREFYEGAIAQQVARDCHHLGGHLTLADLQQYEVIERTPLTTDYRGNTLLTNPPPSSGGTLIAFALKLLETIDLPAMTWDSAEHLQALIQVMRLTNLARKDGYDLKLYEETIATEFLEPAHLAIYAAQLQSAIGKWGSTTHLSAIDGEGNAASVTTSNGEGSSYFIPGTGIMLNNMLGEADLNPQGFHQWQENVRLSSMMAPTIVLKDGRPEIVLGSGGSNRIRTAILQVISKLLDFQLDVESAVNGPRLHWEADRLDVEPGFASDAVRVAALSVDQMTLWQQQSLFFGGVHTLAVDPAGQITGAGDRRRHGVFLAV